MQGVYKQKYRRKREAKEAAEAAAETQYRKDELAYRITQGQMEVAAGDLAYATAAAHIQYHADDGVLAAKLDYAEARDEYDKMQQSIVQQYFQTGGKAS